LAPVSSLHQAGLTVVRPQGRRGGVPGMVVERACKRAAHPLGHSEDERPPMTKIARLDSAVAAGTR